MQSCKDKVRTWEEAFVWAWARALRQPPTRTNNIINNRIVGEDCAIRFLSSNNRR
jgi:hypothetical protein